MQSGGKVSAEGGGKTMAIVIYVLTHSKSLQVVHNVTIDTKPNELYGAIIRLHMNITINKRISAIMRLYQIQKRAGESNTEFISRLERVRDELPYVYNHTVAGIWLIAFFWRALEGDMNVAILPWCGLENATYARLRQQVTDRDDLSTSKSQSEMLSFGGSNSSQSRSRSHPNSQSSNRSRITSPFRRAICLLI